MNNEQLAQKYANRLNKCLLAIKIFIISAVVAVVTLLIFILAASGSSLKDSNPNGVLLGVIICGMFAAACVIGAIAVLCTAKITITKLKKLGADKT